MTDKSLKTGAFLITIGFSFLIGFVFFNVCISTFEHKHKQTNDTFQVIKNKVDSLENVINTSFKDKRDTTIIKLIPQEIKIYYPKEKI